MYTKHKEIKFFANRQNCFPSKSNSFIGKLSQNLKKKSKYLNNSYINGICFIFVAGNFWKITNSVRSYSNLTTTEPPRHDRRD